MTTQQGLEQPLAGIDIGGTKTSALLVTDDGRVLGRETVPTPAKEGGAMIADTAAALVRTLVERVGLAPRAAGVGASGVIDAQGAVLAASDSFHNWVGFRLSDEIASRLGVPTIALNDVNAFLVGEATWGSAHGEDVLGVTIGTGVGGAMLLGGTLRNGPNGGAGEIGHTARYSDIVCTCGRVGHLETVAAGRSIARAYLEATGREGVTAKDIADLACDGDPVAIRLFERAGHTLAQACVSAATLLDVPSVVVGGSLANAWDLMQPSIDRVLRDDPPVTGAPLTISRGSLGGDAVALGAAAALRQNMTAPTPEGTDAP